MWAVMGSEHTRRVLAPGIFALVVLVWGCGAYGLDPALDVSQYAHTSWKIREGFATGTIHQIAQTPDGYLWLATEAGLLRFDGIRTVRWQPPQGEHLPSNDIRGLIAARDGTLWIGTAKGLASWKDGKLTHYLELDKHDVAALLEDREGTVWAGGVVWEAGPNHPGKLCAIHSGGIECYGADGVLSFGVTSIYEDSRYNLWLGAGNGLWRWRPGPPEHYALPELNRFALPGMVFPWNAFLDGDHGALLIGGRSGVKQFVDGKLKEYPFPSGGQQFHEGGTLLRDRNGGLWIGTLDRGILHVHQGRADVFAQSDGLSGNSVQSFFEDQEGSIWVATTNGLDRFRDYAVSTISVKQGLSSPFVVCVLAAKDGSVWLGTSDGLNRWKDGQVTTYRRPSASTAPRANGIPGANKPGGVAHEILSTELPDNYVTSLFQDVHGRIWVSTARGLAYFEKDRLVRLDGVHVTSISQIAGDSAGNLWVTNNDQGLYRLREGRVVEHFPWAELRVRGTNSNPMVAEPVHGGLWLASWSGGVVYFKDGQVRAFYGPAEGLGGGRVNALQLDRDGTLWAATDGGLNRIENGRVTTLTSKNGLRCDTVHDLVEDDAHAFWLYMPCGLVRVARSELEASIADPRRRVPSTVFDSSDGVRSHAGTYGFGPRTAKTPNGKVWFLPLDGVSVVDPRRLAFNNLPPPVRIEQIIADDKTYWQNWSGDRSSSPPKLPQLVRDLTIDYTALSLVAPEKMHFRLKLEGQDRDWREVVNQREVQYSNLGPGKYTFRVTACNNSGVWNEVGDVLDFSIAPAYWQTNWFRALCVAALVALLWMAYQLRLRQLRLQERKLRDVIEIIPTFVWTALPDGSVDFINHRWQEYTGFIIEKAMGQGWREAVHAADLKQHEEKWRASLANGEPLENVLRVRVADGQYRRFLVRAVPLRDVRGKIVKWYGTATDIEDLKRAEQERQGVLERHRTVLERHQAEISALNERLMKAQDEERMRIAGELHDGVLQQLTSIALQLGTATIALPADSEPKAEVREVEKRLIEVGTEIRQLSHELHPTVLQEAGLPAALSSYCEEFSKLRGIPISYQADESVEELSPGAALCIYRIAQEALGNVAKHAKAKQVEVRLTRSDSRVCLLVSDDGVGFHRDGGEKSGGLGLINMRERVRQLNGTFEFDSQPGRGTTVKAEVPFRPAP